jgi:hypothetical protein
VVVSHRAASGALGVVLFLPAHKECAEGEEQDRGDEALRPEAVDAPLLQDVGLEVAEEGGAEEADLRDLEEQPPASHQGQDGDESVADDAYGSYRDMRRAGLLVEGFGGEDGETAVVNGSAVEALGDGAWGGEAGVHVVNVQRHRGDYDSCHCKQRDQILHGFDFTSTMQAVRSGEAARIMKTRPFGLIGDRYD